MYPDGVSYLDVGDAFWRGDWHNAINAYWSPLYPLIVGVAVKIVRPSLRWEYPLVHLVNFFLYFVALLCFDYFLRTFLKKYTDAREASSASYTCIPNWGWLLAGYSAFIVSCLALITLSFVSGDIIVAAVIFLASALIIKVEKENASSAAFALLGIVLGIGYLAKAAMFLMSIPFIGATAATQGSCHKKLRCAVIALGAFLAVSGPFMFLLSISKGRPTFGDSGKINYLMNVGNTQFFTPHDPGAEHQPRKLETLPNAYVYATPIVGTYPLWYDPSHWHEGIRPQFQLSRQVRTVGLAIAEFAVILFSPSMGLCISGAVLFLFLLSPDVGKRFTDASRLWYLWIPALAGIAIYSLVVIQPRYIAGLICILWIVGFSGARLPDSVSSRRIVALVAIAVFALSCLQSVLHILEAQDERVFAEADVATTDSSRAAEALIANGLRPGDKIGVIAPWLFPSRQGAYIARLARVRIIGEARPDEYWSADESIRARLNSQFTAAGANAILTSVPPPHVSNWIRLGSTNYYLFLLPRS